MKEPIKPEKPRIVKTLGGFDVSSRSSPASPCSSMDAGEAVTIASSAFTPVYDDIAVAARNELYARGLIDPHDKRETRQVIRDVMQSILRRQMVKLKTKSALSYFGSDSEVAAELASMLDDCKHVTIPFCGGMSILPHLKARAIVANDKHRAALNFYRQMSDSGNRDRLIAMCQQTLSHPGELDDAKEILSTSANTTESAWAFWAICWIGRKGKGGTKHQGGMPSVRRTANGGTNASRIRAAASDLREWAKQFERCEWESVDFRELLPKVADRDGCGVYCDPPWVGVGRNYLHNFSDEDHRDLAAALERFEAAAIVVRYGDSELVRELYDGWRIIEAESRDQCNATKGEVWITNQR